MVDHAMHFCFYNRVFIYLFIFAKLTQQPDFKLWIDCTKKASTLSNKINKLGQINA